MTKSSPEPPKHDSPVREPEAKAYQTHAQLYWAAEQENAERLSKQVRLLTGLSGTLIAAMGYGLTVTYARQLTSVSAAALGWLVFAALLILVAVIVPWKRISALFLITLDVAFWVLLWCGGAAEPYLHSVFAGSMLATLLWMLFFLLVATRQLLIPVAAKAADPAGLALRGHAATKPSVKANAKRLARLTVRILDGSANSDAPADLASSGLEFSGASLKYAANQLLPGEWSAFRRQYRAALELQKRNLELRNRIRIAQRSLCMAFTLVPCLLILLIQADALAPDSGDSVEPGRPAAVD